MNRVQTSSRPARDIANASAPALVSVLAKAIPKSDSTCKGIGVFAPIEEESVMRVPPQKDSWEDFQEQIVSWPWFADDRPKTLAALKKLWERMPVDAMDKLRVPFVVFAPSPDVRGQVYSWFNPANNIDRTDAFIYLSPELERKSQGRVNTTVAHEFAHVLLGHFRFDCKNYRPTEGQRKQCKTYADFPGEKAADALIVKWGYRPAYHRQRMRKAA